jgi:CRP-like cAMP-binding protein
MNINMNALGHYAKSYRNGQIIFAEFEVGNTFYLIQSGEVELTKLGENMEKTLAILKPMEMFGEMAILESSPRSATAIARGSCKLLEFDRENFDDLMMRLPEMALKLLKLFITRMHTSKIHYIQIKKQDPLDRLVETFVQLAQGLPAENYVGDVLAVPVEVDTLARLSGLSIEQTRSTLEELSKEKKVEVHTDNILLKKFSFFRKHFDSLSER